VKNVKKGVNLLYFSIRQLYLDNINWYKEYRSFTVLHC